MTQRNHLSPPIFPYPWASAWGEDRYGLWMTMTYKDIDHTFRWIEPGIFMMGSPENEKGRYDDEDLHQVTLTQGFWMADTTVTQAFYQAVMGENPSHFKESEENPVEQISWDNAQIFIKTLNKLFPNLQAGLPTEAQWEYACRAGTTTPFSFGESITAEQVNCSSNYPYADDEEGWYYRETVVPVKSLPANDWGLYEMHGNVWEWCQDVYKEDLGSQPVQDPLESKVGDGRVVRGGSWIGRGGDVRSADRRRNAPDDRYNDLGFRLLLGH